MIRVVYTVTQCGRPVGRLEFKSETEAEVIPKLEDIKAGLDVQLEYIEALCEGLVWTKDT